LVSRLMLPIQAPVETPTALLYSPLIWHLTILAFYTILL